MHPHSLGPGALACTFSLTPAGLGCKSGPAPRCPSLQCLGAPARAARLQQRLGEPRVLPILPDQMPRQICPGLQVWGPRPLLPGGHTRSPAWRCWRGGSASREGQSAPVPTSPAPPTLCPGPCCSRVGAAPGSRRPARPQQKQWLQAACELGAVVAGDLVSGTSREAASRPRSPRPPPAGRPRTLLLCAGRRRCGRVAMPCSLSISSCARGGGWGW